MKKLFSFLMVAVLSTGFVWAWDGDGGLPNPVRVWSDPVIYNYDEQVTWYYDLSSASDAQLDGTSFAIWVWQPGPPTENGLYGNEEGATIADVNPKLILKNEGNKVYSLTLTPTEFFGKTQAEILANGEGGFWQHLRLFDKDGFCVTNCGSFPIAFPHQILKGTMGLANNAIVEVLGGVNEPVVSAVYPSTINATTPIAFIFNNDEAGAEWNKSLHFVSGLNNWNYKVDYVWDTEANPHASDLSKCSQYFGEDYKDFYVFNVKNPSKYYGVPYDYEIRDIQYLFNTFEWAPPIVVFEGEWEFEQATPWKGTGIKTITVPKTPTVLVKDNVLTANASNFEVYNITGVLVAKSVTSTLNVSNLAKGVYIVKTANGSVKVVK